MMGLIRLEMRKNNAAKYVLYAVIATSFLAAFLISFVFFFGFDDPNIAAEITGVSFFVETMTSIVFLVFASVMHSIFTVNAYKNRTMDLMFSYPIKRRDILASKMMAVLLFNLAAITLAKALIYGSIFIVSGYLQPSVPIDFNIFSIPFYAGAVLTSVMTICISLIALFIGMICKSPTATIVASFFLVVLLQGNFAGYTLSGNTMLPILLTFISIVFAVLTISGVEKKDVLQF